MALDRHAKRLLDLLAAGGAGSKRLSTQERRLAFEQLMDSSSGRADAAGSIHDTSLPGPDGPVRIRVYTPQRVSGAVSPALVYFHGGGWIAGGIDSHLGLCARLAEASGCRIVIVDYRLAPEHKFPAALEDGIAVVEWLSANAARLSIDPKRLGIAGDSAGGNIAAAICHALKGKSRRPLALQVLLCPILDGVGESQSRRVYARGFLLDATSLADDFSDYCPPDLDRRDPRLSPIYGTDFSGLPPTHIYTAEFDPVRDDGRVYAEMLATAGLPVTYCCDPGMIHLFYGMPKYIPRADIFVRDVGVAIREALDGDSRS